jgi:hypothetical protein
MKKRFKNTQIILVIAISVFILTLPVYLGSTKLAQTKFVSSGLSFENPGQEERFPDNENRLNVFGPTAFLTIFLLCTNLFEKSCHLFPRSLSLCQKTSVLRC